MTKIWRRNLGSVIALFEMLVLVLATTSFAQFNLAGNENPVEVFEQGNDDPSLLGNDSANLPASEGSILETKLRPVCKQPSRFSNYEDIEKYLEDSRLQLLGNRSWFGMTTPRFGYSTTYSEGFVGTNVQVEGVDEADFVKTDGEYVYVISHGDVIIARAYPPEAAKNLSMIRTGGSPIGIFVKGSRLAIFQSSHSRSYGGVASLIDIYDISNKSNPRLVQNITVTGFYADSRMVGEYVYVIINGFLRYAGDEVPLPVLEINGVRSELEADKIGYFDELAPHYSLLLIMSVNLQTQQVNLQAYLLDHAREFYVSSYAMFLTTPHHSVDFDGNGTARQARTTIIRKIPYMRGRTEGVCSAEVPGRVLNRFSMDEYDGYFRIAMTTGFVSMTDSTARNHVYVLNNTLHLVGQIENLAPGERIYSARFLRDRCYLVTFRKIDPFFVIDLSNPESPEVLGSLKIPGVSYYLHPYGRDFVLGVGKDTVPAENGNFSWFQGVKISLFNVTDVENPKEISKHVIGERGTSSEGFHDHKAFLVNKSRNLIVIPLQVAVIDRSKHPNPEPFTSGELVWQGAYVMSVTTSNELILKGRLTHIDCPLEQGDNLWRHHSSFIRRTFLIGDVIYTVSDDMIRMNSLDTMDDLGKLDL